MRWKCGVCGYIHEGKQPPKQCPVCGAPRSKFRKIAEKDMTVIDKAKNNVYRSTILKFKRKKTIKKK